MRPCFDTSDVCIFAISARLTVCSQPRYLELIISDQSVSVRPASRVSRYIRDVEGQP